MILPGWDSVAFSSTTSKSGILRPFCRNNRVSDGRRRVAVGGEGSVAGVVLNTKACNVCTGRVIAIISATARFDGALIVFWDCF